MNDDLMYLFFFVSVFFSYSIKIGSFLMFNILNINTSALSLASQILNNLKLIRIEI